MHFEDHYQEDDGLGYYDDGVKRTLTDEQIAMFRHSEIQAILKERRLQQQEASEAEKSEPQDEVEACQQKPSEETSRLGSPPVKHEQRKQPRKSRRAEHRSNWTHRRIARELDENKSANVVLEY